VLLLTFSPKRSIDFPCSSMSSTIKYLAMKDTKKVRVRTLLGTANIQHPSVLFAEQIIAGNRRGRIQMGQLYLIAARLCNTKRKNGTTFVLARDCVNTTEISVSFPTRKIIIQSLDDWARQRQIGSNSKISRNYTLFNERAPIWSCLE
jgi:hypothetical protein